VGLYLRHRDCRTVSEMRSLLHRRDLVRLAAAGLLSAFSSACRARSPRSPSGPSAGDRRQAYARGHLLSRPRPPAAGSPPTGLVPLQLSGSDRDGVLYVPASYDPATAAPLLLSLHGAGGSGRRGLPRLQTLAETHGLLVLCPDSRGSTWDLVRGGFGPDVEFVDRALDLVFARYAVDPSRIVAEGFSDGASYALSLGLLNGDLLNHVIAFSPGFVLAERRRGRPRCFVSHGTRDPILPIDRCSRRIVRDLRDDRYDVSYTEFEGGHVVPPEIARDAVDWLLARG
jgi:phospholipase/carboxylesterase